MRTLFGSVICVVSILLVSGCTDQRSQSCTPPCGPAQECSDGVCRDLTCGGCGAGRVCVNGYCLRPCSQDDDCTGFETCCEHIRACVDLRTDFYNCGSCANACPTARSNYCANSSCGCEFYSPEPCQEGFGCCADGCKDLEFDNENCGECGHDCGGLDCVGGECRCSADEPCTTGEECCADGCRNLSSDNANCGACGNDCEEIVEECCDGECARILEDLAHCGACGNDCDGSERCCWGECADTRSDRFNCGGCREECGSGSQCVDGDCT